MKGAHLLLAYSLLALSSSFAYASGPSPLQDFCVANGDVKDVLFGSDQMPKQGVFEYVMKHAKRPNTWVAEDLINPKVFVNGKFCEDPKLAKAEDFTVSGLNVPRNTSNPVGSTVTPVNVAQIPGLDTLDNRLITQILYLGDLFVFPVGLIHFQFNVGKTNVVAFAALRSQNPGVITIANAVFAANPPINPDVLVKAFQ
ncbi:RmlC-like cupins superfamily protein, putative [Theobroma cacao]|uniref:Germin-like protein n=1 Tax=Theobroma cacao TaxID=3641 RepID=A0A061F0B5_THECC|nr:RmlC-like cupins superfamily protein, putative [Theobroma cacao]